MRNKKFPSENLPSLFMMYVMRAKYLTKKRIQKVLDISRMNFYEKVSDSSIKYTGAKTPLNVICVRIHNLASKAMVCEREFNDSKRNFCREQILQNL